MPSRLQHALNALHEMAVLVACGLPRCHALRPARGWDRIVHPWLYGARSHRGLSNVEAHLAGCGCSDFVGSK